MASAIEMGVRRARDYLRRLPDDVLAKTFTQFCAIGRLDTQRYKITRAREDFAQGWEGIGKQFLTLFQPDDEEQLVAETHLGAITEKLQHTQKDILRLQQWRQEEPQFSLRLVRHLTRSRRRSKR